MVARRRQRTSRLGEITGKVYGVYSRSYEPRVNADITTVAKLPTENPWSNYSGNYSLDCNILENECNTFHDIRRALQNYTNIGHN